MSHSILSAMGKLTDNYPTEPQVIRFDITQELYDYLLWICQMPQSNQDRLFGAILMVDTSLVAGTFRVYWSDGVIEILETKRKE